MSKKTAGRLNSPSAEAEFNAIPLGKLCGPVKGVFYRLHSLNRTTGKPWDPVFFSQQDRSRFDPATGVGTMCIGSTLVGALMEIFNDRWGPLGDSSRSLTTTELKEWWVTLIATPNVIAFETQQLNLSKIGTDSQLLTGDYPTTRQWAQRIMAHPAAAGGILYASRHDNTQRNLALFNRPGLSPAVHDPKLLPPAGSHGSGPANVNGPLVYGPAILLRDHPELNAALQTLEVAILP